MAHLLFTGIFLVWATLVGASDIRSRRIPNALVIAGLVGALTGAAISGNPFGVTMGQSMIGAFVGLVCFSLFFALRVMGAADVKVFAVLGAWCGVQALPWLWLIASIAAAFHALSVMVLSRTSISALCKRDTPAMTLGGRRATPYAALLVMPAVVWLLHLTHVRGV
ncbi:A24 family peptidase [Burkholderia latens]|uniref:A24 family peptidase n=1 Tax=Burkholderia latens TaxID=488446 RepID=UPI001AE882EB|nr:prepilin peptidase [Burkholderia latens]QTO49867.1 prepilin peptidase [Burkholderia latens]